MYNNKIDAKWQKIWEKNNIFHTEIESSKDKYYVLDMFPYPSGSMHLVFQQNNMQFKLEILPRNLLLKILILLEFNLNH